jgi:hypothetical protein
MKHDFCKIQQIVKFTWSSLRMILWVVPGFHLLQQRLTEQNNIFAKKRMPNMEQLENDFGSTFGYYHILWVRYQFCEKRMPNMEQLENDFVGRPGFSPVTATLDRAK